MGYRIGVDVGGTRIKLGVVNEKGEILSAASESTDKRSYEALLNQIAEACRRLAGAYSVSGVGLGLPCLVDAETGQTGICVNLPLSRRPVRRDLEEKLPFPVHVENDANCAALAEYRVGAGRGCRTMALVTIGTGVGGGFIENGVLFRSQGAAEFGHIVSHVGGRPCPCGQNGCLEQYASATALQKDVLTAVQNAPDSTLAGLVRGEDPCIAVFSAAAKGCPVAGTVLEHYFNELASGLCSIKWVLAPDRIVLGGGISAQGDALLQPLRQRVPGVTLCVAELHNDAGLIGASLLGPN